MLTLAKLHKIAQRDEFRGAVLVAALGIAHEIMNDADADKRLKAKAVDLINQPDQYKERLAFSVVTRFKEEDVIGETPILNIGDERLVEYVRDVFDAMAGVGL